MSADDILEHSYTLTVPPELMGKVLKALRFLREEARSGGGFTRLVRKEDRLTLTVKGSDRVVLDTIEMAKKADAKIAEHNAARRAAAGSLYNRLQQHRRQRGVDALDMLLTELAKSGGGRRE